MAVVHFIVQWSPWPLAVLNCVSMVVSVAAVVTAWKSSDRVVVENRRWTRSWRIFVVVAFNLWVRGVWIPVGAVYVLVKWRRPSRSRAVARA